NAANTPNTMIAVIALEQKDTARAIRALEDVLKVDHSDVASARKLAELVAPLKDDVRSENAYRRLVAIDPFDVQAETALGKLALKKKDARTAIQAFRSALASNPPDRAEAHADLAEAYVLAGDMAEAKRQTLARPEIAAGFHAAQARSAAEDRRAPVIPLRDVIPSRTTPVVTISLVVLNALIFLYELSLGEQVKEFMFSFGLVPAYFSWLNVVTSMFLHGGFLHAAGNMLYLWIFGDNVEDRMGHGRFLAF